MNFARFNPFGGGRRSKKVLILWDIVTSLRSHIISNILPQRLRVSDQHWLMSHVLVRCTENCRIPKELWKKDSPTRLATRIGDYFGRERGPHHPGMVTAFRSLPPDAPFSDVLDELQTPGGFEILGFRPKLHKDGKPVKNHTADDVLK